MCNVISAEREKGYFSLYIKKENKCIKVQHLLPARQQSPALLQETTFFPFYSPQVLGYTRGFKMGKKEEKKEGKKDPNELAIVNLALFLEDIS